MKKFHVPSSLVACNEMDSGDPRCAFGQRASVHSCGPSRKVGRNGSGEAGVVDNSTLNRILTVALLIGLGCASAATFASDPFTPALGEQRSGPNQRFGINANWGKAWVEFDAPEDVGGADQPQRVTIPGLTYDRKTSQIVLSARGQRAICANVHMIGNKPSKQPHIEPTGACALTLRAVSLPVSSDIGFYEMEHFEVQLRLSRPTAGGPGEFAE